MTTNGKFVYNNDDNVNLYNLIQYDFCFKNGSYSYGKKSNVCENYASIQSSKTFNVCAGIYNVQYKDEFILSRSKNSIIINDGTFNINSTDDCFYTYCGNIIIENGEYTLYSKANCFRSDSSISIYNGSINILNCYEGFEANAISVYDGDINVYSEDDCFESLVYQKWNTIVSNKVIENAISMIDYYTNMYEMNYNGNMNRWPNNIKTYLVSNSQCSIVYSFDSQKDAANYLKQW